MRWFKVFVNHTELGAIQALSYADAKSKARKLYGRRCDCIG